MLIEIFKNVANDTTSTTDYQQVAMTKASKMKEATENSEPNSNVVPSDDIGDDDL